MTFDEAAKAILLEAQLRGYNRTDSIACLSTAIQESGLRAGVVSPNGKWVGYYQQDAGYPGRYDPRENYREFFNRLDKKRASAGASPDIWLNIFWLQQAPGRPTAQLAYDMGRKAYITEIQQHTAKAAQIYDRFIGTTTTPGEPVAISGDPIWLEDVLREALGDRLVVHDGWKERGAGGFMGVIWGTMIHHTGNVNERVEVIRDGVQQPSGWLPGPLSQCLITPDGKCHLIAVGPCNHAGGGNYRDLTNGNRDSIGFECAYSGSGKWPDAQIWTMRDATAAVSRKLGKRAEDSVCGHKEYAKPAGRKPDPGNMSMDWFRGEVNKKLDGKIPPGQPGPVAPPVIIPGPDKFIDNLTHMSDRQLLVEMWHQLRGPDGRGWPQLEGKSVVDFLDDLGRRLDGLEAALKVVES